jgi:hypothetical protein
MKDDNAIDEAISALETAQNGLKWYQAENPDNISDVDYEAHEQINQALTKLQALKDAVPEGVMDILRELNSVIQRDNENPMSLGEFEILKTTYATLLLNAATKGESNVV